jgi:hypothetical protein
MESLQPRPLQNPNIFAWSLVREHFITNGCISCVWGYMCMCSWLLVIPMISMCHNNVHHSGAIQPCTRHKKCSLCSVLGWIASTVVLNAVSVMRPSTKCIIVSVHVLPMIKMCHIARQGILPRPSPMCKPILDHWTWYVDNLIAFYVNLNMRHLCLCIGFANDYSVS